MKDSLSAQPSVSLLVRSMNRTTLDELLEHLGQLTYPHCQLIVVNASGKPHAPLGRSLPFESHMLEPGKPLTRAAAANVALDAVTTPLAMFIDDDDLVDPEHVCRLADALVNNPAAPAAYTGVRLDTGQATPIRSQLEPWHLGMLLWRNFLPIHAVMFRLSAVNDLGSRFDTDFNTLEDWDFWLQLSQAGDFFQVPGLSATYRIALGQSSLSQDRDIEQYKTQRLQLHKKWLPQLPPEMVAEAGEVLNDRMEQAEWDKDQLQDQLNREAEQRQETQQRLDDAHNQLDDAHNQLADAHNRLDEAHKQLTQRELDIEMLLNSRSFKAMAPLRGVARAFRHVNNTLTPKPAPPSPAIINQTSPNGQVDIIVPVYKGLAETRACLQSVWTSQCKTPYRLIVINDASPEPELTEWLRSAATRNPMLLLENDENLGFVGTVNRGMSFSNNADVVLLNSDAEVANDWLDRLVAAAYQTGERPIATVTPFSNNATICSYPRFCEDNELPSDYDLAALDKLFANANPGQMVEVPTGIGFCMYIRFEALRQVGLFDEVRFGKGYGEENDFCMRAINVGWRHVHALDVFAWHKGSVSFGDSQPERVTKALEILHDLHPDYDRRVHQFIAQDPAHQARIAVDLARLRSSSRPRIVLINHQRGGGTERHCHELAKTLGEQAEWLLLSPTPHGQIALRWINQGEALALFFTLPKQFDVLIDCLRALGVSRVHVHHWLGLPQSIQQLARALDVPQDVTLHDYYAVCPQITLTQEDNQYCGELGETQCHECLARQPAPTGESITAWRARHATWLAQSERVITPSHNTAERIARYMPDIKLIATAHPDCEERMQPIPVLHWNAPAPGEPLRIAVLGALSAIKGADVLEAVAQQAQQQNSPLTFKLFGFCYRHLDTPGNLTQTGRYDDAQLPNLLRDWKPHIVWFPAQWPETYSYTLSTCLELGLPVVSTHIGAIPERISGRDYSWTLPWDTSPVGWCEWFTQRLQTPPQRLTISDEQLPANTNRRFYRAHYMQAVAAPPNTLPALPDWERYITPTTSGRSSLRTRTVLALYWLREQAWLRGVARRVPTAWQRRLKSWLLRESA